MYIHYIKNSHVFSFEFVNDGMEPSKCHSFISLLFILNCLSKTLVIIIIILLFFKWY